MAGQLQGIFGAFWPLLATACRMYPLFMCGSAGASQIPVMVRGEPVEQRRDEMRTFAKFALGALMVAGAATATTAAMTSPAEARGSFSFSFGYPGYYGGYYGGYPYAPAYYDPYYYRPYPAYYGRPYYGRPYWGGYRGYYGYRGGYRGHYGYRGGYRRW
jgi:hypothetical protein